MLIVRFGCGRVDSALRGALRPEPDLQIALLVARLTKHHMKTAEERYFQRLLPVQSTHRDAPSGYELETLMNPCRPYRSSCRQLFGRWIK